MSMIRRFKPVALCFTVFLTMCCGIVSAEVLRDVSYCTNSGVVLKLDLYLPEKKSDKPMPLAVFVHGGAWQHGSKAGGVWLSALQSELNRRGFAVASVDYRLAPEYKWPLFMNDVKCSIRFLRANAAKYHLATKRIGAWGTSAGGHLVSMLGTADESAKLEGEYYTDQSSSVQAVVDFFGPTDMPLLVSERQHVERAKIVFGADLAKNGMTNQALLEQASPITYVTKHSAPTMIIHGTRDEVVHPNQAQVFYDKLKAAGVPTRMTMVRNGTHGLAKADIDPGREELVQQSADWLEHYVK